MPKTKNKTKVPREILKFWVSINFIIAPKNGSILSWLLKKRKKESKYYPQSFVQFKFKMAFAVLVREVFDKKSY